MVEPSVERLAFFMKNNIFNVNNQVQIQKLENYKNSTMKLYKRVFAWDYKSAARYYNCGSHIALQNGAIKEANFCRDRFCPMCTARRTRKLEQQNMAAYQYIKDHNEGARMLFLTLTVPNVQLWQLRKTLRAMSEGWNRLRNDRNFKKQPVIGFFRKLEVTYNEETRTYHPHYHILLTVNGHFTSIRNIVSWWSRAMRYETSLVCHIKAVRGDMDSIKEMSKYMTKPDDVLSTCLDSDTWFMLRAAFSQVKEVTYAGCWRVARRELGYIDIDQDDLTDHEEITHSKAPIEWYVYFYNIGYVLVNVSYEWDIGDQIAEDLAKIRAS